MVNPGPIATVSVYSSPKNCPDPYKTDYTILSMPSIEPYKGLTTVSFVGWDDDVFLYALPAPSQVLELPLSTIRESAKASGSVHVRKLM